MSGDMLRGKWGLVTGASSGLGVDFAKELAARGCNLILVARRADLLRQQAAAIAGQYGVAVEAIPLDLAASDAPQALYDRTRDLGRDITVLINNAGYAIYGPFVETPWERERDMLELDIVTLVGLTKFFARDMVARGSGFILLLASIGAFQPTPLYATYSAAKSFVLNFGEALNHELRRTGVRCTVLSPGITATGFLRVSGQEATAYQRGRFLTRCRWGRLAPRRGSYPRRGGSPWSPPCVPAQGRSRPQPISARSGSNRRRSMSPP